MQIMADASSRELKATASVLNPGYVMTTDSIESFIGCEKARRVSGNSISRIKRVTGVLYDWLPADKELTKERLHAWREELKAHGYSVQTELNYVKCINRYLDFMGFSDIRFNRGRMKNVAGEQFGYLTAIEPAGKRNRRDIVWRCRCRCGAELELPATRLLTGNTMSCGCLKKEHLRKVNKYFLGTSLSQTLKERVHSDNAVSGYTGVTQKRGKWNAYIKYKGRLISLGCYSGLEDAVRARALGKEAVQTEALVLLEQYELLHQEEPPGPGRPEGKQPGIKTAVEVLKNDFRAVRSDNSSGCPGVSRKRNKWVAKITSKKVTYHLGQFDSLEKAVLARKSAEEALRRTPERFPEWVANWREKNL